MDILGDVHEVVIPVKKVERWILNEETFNQWMNSKETQFIKRYLKGLRQDKLDKIVEIGFGSQKMDDLLALVKLSGFIVGLNEFLELTFEDFGFEEPAGE